MLDIDVFSGSQPVDHDPPNKSQDKFEGLSRPGVFKSETVGFPSDKAWTRAPLTPP